MSDKQQKVKVLITVKAKPYPSKSYKELVCTAGITDDGKWIRLAPIPFRYIKKSYEKFDWIELEVIKHDKDKRFETFRPVDPNKIKIIGHIGTENNWESRLNIFKDKIKHSLCEFIENYHKKCKEGEGKQYEAPSLLMIKPYKISNFVIKKADSKWKPGWQRLFDQEPLFDEMKMKPLDKIPYSFFYNFTCSPECRGHKLKIEDWEIYALARKYLGNPDKLKEKVEEKYKKEFLSKKDLYFFIGSTKEFHKRKAKNPYIIIGVFWPPKVNQLKLF